MQMGLRGITLPEAKIELPGGGFAVRGLSLDDIIFLVQRHGAGLQEAFNRMMATTGELSTDTVASFALPFLQAAPEIAAEMIACASGDKEAADVAARLPFPVQIEALEQIARLTFEASGGPKKLVESVIKLAQGMTGLLTDLKA